MNCSFECCDMLIFNYISMCRSSCVVTVVVDLRFLTVFLGFNGCDNFFLFFLWKTKCTILNNHFPAKSGKLIWNEQSKEIAFHFWIYWWFWWKLNAFDATGTWFTLTYPLLKNMQVLFTCVLYRIYY